MWIAIATEAKAINADVKVFEGRIDFELNRANSAKTEVCCPLQAT